MAQFTVYASTDGSAPVCDGQVGSLVNLLDKILVAGYGAKAAAGWTKPYTGTNKAAFLNAGSSQQYLRVQDDGPGAGGALEARVTGYEAMTTVDAGTGPFPTAAQGVGGVAMLVCRKSVAASAVTRAWIAFADSRTLYLFIMTGDLSSGTPVYSALVFGEIYSFKPSTDVYRSVLIARVAENSAAASAGLDTLSALNAATTGCYTARSYTGTGTSVSLGRHGDAVRGGSTAMTGTCQYPNGPDGGIYLSPVWIHEVAGLNVRGKLRGIYQFCHLPASINDGDTFTGVGAYAGKSFRVVKPHWNVSNSLVPIILETTATLDTNP